MPLDIGSSFGPFDVLAPLGKGGMGEVYRALDRRLKRQVALKVLPSAVALDADRLARFRREAEVLASLSHPNIAAVYGLETDGCQDAIVMELIEGPTLADRIAQASVPLDEALAIAGQIVDALEAAHERGIVHRDLKPANIKVRDDGTVKVLDFGLAKLADAGSAAPDPSDSPTITAGAMTGLGMILGTAAYMSPEQARGRQVDKRTDVWAFGAVLYEMLARRCAFAGDDVTETLAAVVKTTPDWNALPPDTPPHIVRLIQRCLEKDRRARVGDAAVARFVLSGETSLPESPRGPAASNARWRLLLPWAAALGTGLLAGWLVSSRQQGSPPAVARLQMAVAPADFLPWSTASVRPSQTAFAVSPDGQTIAFVAANAGAPGTPSVPRLYLRPLNRAPASAVQSTEGASGPFYSPDGSWIGFWVGNTLKKIPAGGGAPTVIAEVPSVPGSVATWGEDDYVYFAHRSTGLSKIPASGGSPVAVTRASADVMPYERHLLPRWVTGANALLFTIQPDAWNWATTRVAIQDLDSNEQRVLLEGGADARYVPTGQIVYMATGTLMAVPFDIRSKQITGAPVALAENVSQAINQPNTDDESGAGQFALSDNGTLVYALGGIAPGRQNTLVWVDRRGVAEPMRVTLPGSGTPRLSPDGKRLALSARSSNTRRDSEVWVADVLRGAPTRLTLDGGRFPVWSPDGTRLAYGSDGIYVTRADGSGTPDRIVDAPAALSFSWVRAANALVYRQEHGDGARIWAVPLEGARTPRIVVDSRFPLWQSDVSPDGRLIAYVSLESGRPEVYVHPFAGAGGRLRVSEASGFDPLWTPDGRELVYRAADGDGQRFMAVTVRSTSPFEFDPPRLLFEAKGEDYDTTAPERSWDISPDGQRFLLATPVPSTDVPTTVLNVVLNWTQELRQLVTR